MRINEDSYRDTSFRREYQHMYKFAKDVERLHKAHKRAKKELRKQQKALAKKNEYISNLELKVTCAEQENKALRKEHSKSETEVQGRIIQSMNGTIVKLRTQLNETEEKYNELLKHIINEK